MKKTLLLCGIATLFLSCLSRKIETITIKGSDTEVNLVLELAEAYMEKDAAVSISISGGGSGVGVAALLSDRADVANSSRPLNEAEQAYATRLGKNIQATIFATDALAVIVNPASGIRQLSLEQLGRIFSGQTQNWRELGGADMPISLYGRQSNSGTFLYFREKVLGRDYSSNLKQLNGTAQMLEAIRSDPNGIGYVGFGYLFDKNGNLYPGIEVLALPDDHGTYTSPLDKAAVAAGKYPLTRPLYQFTQGAPQGKTLAFFQYELSPEGQEIIRQNGYLPAAQ